MTNETREFEIGDRVVLLKPDHGIGLCEDTIREMVGSIARIVEIRDRDDTYLRIGYQFGKRRNSQYWWPQEFMKHVSEEEEEEEEFMKYVSEEVEASVQCRSEDGWDTGMFQPGSVHDVSGISDYEHSTTANEVRVCDRMEVEKKEEFDPTGELELNRLGTFHLGAKKKKWTTEL